MSNPINETFKFSSRAAARIAAEQGGWDLDDVLMCADGEHRWGWELAEEPNFQATLEAPPKYRRANAEPLPAQPLVDAETEPTVADTGIACPLIFAASAYDEHDGDAVEQQAAEEEVAQPEHEEEAPPATEVPAPALAVVPIAVEQSVQHEAGELILQINGPMLPAAAKLRAVHFARQLGLEITLRDAATMAVVEVVKVAARGKGGRGNASDLIIELCTRPEGATATELAKAAKDRGCAFGRAQEAVGKVAEEHGLHFAFEAVFRDKTKPPMIAYFLRHRDVEQAIAAD